MIVFRNSLMSIILFFGILLLEWMFVCCLINFTSLYLFWRIGNYAPNIFPEVIAIGSMLPFAIYNLVHAIKYYRSNNVKKQTWYFSMLVCYVFVCVCWLQFGWSSFI